MITTVPRLGASLSFATVDPMADTRQDKATEVLALAAQDPSVPQIYFNGFTMATGTADALLVLQRTGKPVASLYGSLIAFKTLAVKLTQLVSDFETATKVVIPLTEQVEQAFTKPNEASEH